jgi:hypothetical protein
MANLIVSAVSTFDNKGLKKGKKEISTFEKQVKSFAKVFATAFSVRALTNYSKKAVQAFMADEKAAKSLEQQLKNTGYQFSSPSVELYIANLQKTTGVLDDELRPAFQQLLTVTGSITMSQDALNTAMNVSAATGRSLSQVTTALSRAYAGNTTGLSRLGAGLDKALLKTGDMDKIMAKLNEKFAGQSAARLGTYAGKMDLLAAAAANSQEIIGKGLLDALTALGDDNSIENITTGMENFATAISEVVVGLGQVGSKLKDLTNVPGVGNIFDVRNIPVIGAYIGGLRQIGRGAMPQQDRGGQERTAGRIAAQQRKIEAQAIKNTNVLRKVEIDQLKKRTAVDQLKDKFDLERIGLMAALNAATDDETKLRLKAQLAILDNNEAMAKKLLAEMEAAEKLKKLSEALDQAARATIGYFTALAQSLLNSPNYAGMTYQQILDERLRESGNIGLSPIIPRTSSNSPGLPESYFQNLGNQLQGSASYAGMSASEIAMERIRESGNRTPGVNITVDAAQSGDRFSQLIAEMIQSATRSGFSTSAAGQLP